MCFFFCYNFNMGPLLIAKTAGKTLIKASSMVVSSTTKHIPGRVVKKSVQGSQQKLLKKSLKKTTALSPSKFTKKGVKSSLKKNIKHPLNIAELNKQIIRNDKAFKKYMLNDITLQSKFNRYMDKALELNRIKTRSDKINSIGKGIIDVYNKYKQIEQTAYLLNQIDNNEVDTEKVVWYLRDMYFHKIINKAIYRGQIKKPKVGFKDVQEAIDTYGEEELLRMEKAYISQHKLSSSKNKMYIDLISSWLQNIFIDDHNSAEASEIGLGEMKTITLFFIPEQTNNYQPRIYTNMLDDVLVNWINAPSAGSFWYYNIRPFSAIYSSASLQNIIDYVDKKKQTYPQGMKNLLQDLKNVRTGNKAPQQFTRKYVKQAIHSMEKRLDIAIPRDIQEYIITSTPHSEMSGHSWRSIQGAMRRLSIQMKLHHNVDVSNYTNTFIENQNIFKKASFTNQTIALRSIDVMSKQSFKQTKGEYVKKNLHLFNTRRVDNGVIYRYAKDAVVGATKVIKILNKLDKMI